MCKSKKVLSLIFAAVMLFCCMSFGVFAANDTVTVTFSAFDGNVIMPKQSLTVSDGTAEAYGYEPLENDHNGEKIYGVTALDVLAAAHKAYYGDKFTPSTASEYLDVVKGQIKLAFGKNANSSSFAVNNKAPHDDVYREDPVWGSSYTGYSICETRISSGDYMAYFFYQDKYFYSDMYAWFNVGGEMSDSERIVVGNPVTLTLKGFCFGWYGCYKEEDQGIAPLAGVDVYLVKDGEYTLIGKTDENGSLTFTPDSKGDYRLCAYGETLDEYETETPVSAAWFDLKVQTRAQYNLQKIIDFFRGIIEAIRNLFR